MSAYSISHRSQVLSQEHISAVQAQVEEWLNEQVKTGGFESAWAGAGNIVGGSFPDVNSAEELAIVLFG
jgi:hypothetical protein